MTLITMAMGIGLDVLRPFPMKILVDQVLTRRGASGRIGDLVNSLPGPGGIDGLLLYVCVATVTIFVLKALASLVNELSSVGLGQRMTYDLAADLFGHLQRLSLLFHARRPVGDSLVRVTTDAYCMQELVTGAVLPLFESTVMLMAMFAVMWNLNRPMTLLSLGVVPFMLLATRAFGQPMRTRNRARRDLEARMATIVEQALSAMPAVQAFTREDLEQARFRSYAGDTVTAYLRATSTQLWFKLFVGLITALGTATITYAGGRYVLDGRVTLGTLLVFLAYLAALYGPLNSVTGTATVLQYTAATGARVLEILDTIPDVRDRPGAKEISIRGHVVFEDVDFGYEPATPVLKGVCLDVEPGSTVAIVGSTGAGKTTLVNLLVRFFDPWSGRVTIDGENIRDLQIHSLRHQVAMVLQDPFIFPFSVAENISYGRPAATREQIVAAAVDAHADEFVRALPDGYDTVLGERGTTLSGGQKQRLSVARAFLKDAPILLLDEPTSALDARTESMLLDALARLMEGRTTFIIAHRLSTIRDATRILVLHDGQIVEDGHHQELMSRHGRYFDLYHHQVDLTNHELDPRNTTQGPSPKKVPYWLQRPFMTSHQRHSTRATRTGGRPPSTSNSGQP